MRYEQLLISRWIVERIQPTSHMEQNSRIIQQLTVQLEVYLFLKTLSYDALKKQTCISSISYFSTKCSWFGCHFQNCVSMWCFTVTWDKIRHIIQYNISFPNTYETPFET